MGLGIQIYDINGKNILDASENLTGVISIIETGTQNGEYAFPAEKYRIWYSIIDVIGFDANNLRTVYELPTLNLQDNILKWSFSQSNNRCSAKLVCGFY